MYSDSFEVWWGLHESRYFKFTVTFSALFNLICFTQFWTAITPWPNLELYQHVRVFQLFTVQQCRELGFGVSG